jgi:hypothetical protein
MLEIKDLKSFKQVMLCREIVSSMNQSSGNTVDTYPETSTLEIPNQETTKPITNKVPTDASVIYNENGVKIMLVEQELGLMGPSLKFYIENNTDKTLDIRLTDVYIDGFKAAYSSLYCDNLGAGKKAYNTLSIWESDFEEYTEFPSVVQFIVMIQDSDSWNIIAETEHINICLD